ncbi:MAG: glycerophosphodiester phosphodiesterase family protein [Bacillota bacterium]
MKIFLLIILILMSLYILFYGVYYIFNPSHQGENILAKLEIPYPSIIAHRGASIEAPESTVPAFVRGRNRGADYLEADLQMTKDGKVIVFHDRDLTRTSNVRQVFPERDSYEVKDFTYRELKQLDFGSWFNEAFPRRARSEYEGLEIVTLEELLNIAERGQNNPGLILEFKHPYLYPGIEEKVQEILADKGWLEGPPEIEDTDSGDVNVNQSASRLIFMSFDLQSMEKLGELFADFPTILLITDNMITRSNWGRWLDRAEGVVDGIGAKGFMTWPWHIAAAHDRNLFVFPYTINELWQAKILSRFRADGFITDRPEFVVDFLERTISVVAFDYDENEDEDKNEDENENEDEDENIKE